MDAGDAPDAPDATDTATDDAAATGDADSEESPDHTRVWLVERSYDDRNLITLVYATPDGTHALRRERAAVVMQQQGNIVTAAVDVERDALSPVDEGDQERYANEAKRMRERYDPDEEV